MMTGATPIASALDRVIEVALGGVTGLIVSFFLCRQTPILWSPERLPARSIKWRGLLASCLKV